LICGASKPVVYLVSSLFFWYKTFAWFQTAGFAVVFDQHVVGGDFDNPHAVNDRSGFGWFTIDYG
jgi:hypothetical protein